VTSSGMAMTIDSVFWKRTLREKEERRGDRDSGRIRAFIVSSAVQGPEVAGKYLRRDFSV
jgi:hypothetical protein